jgi:hypothetical protein
MGFPGYLLAAWLVAQPSPTSVAFDLSSVRESDYRRLDGLGLRKKVDLRLVEDGFAVVSVESGGAEVVVRLVAHPSSVVLDGSSSRGTLRRTVRLDGTVAEWHLEICQKVVELTRALRPSRPPPEAVAAAPAPPPEPVATVPFPAPAPVTLAPLWELSLVGGAVGRNSAVDPLVLAAVRVGRAAIGLHVEAGVSWSSGTDTRVTEVQAAAGVGYRFRPAESFALEPALLGGAVLQSYHVTWPFAQSTTGTATVPALWGELRLGWSFAPRWGLGLRVAGGAAPTVTHVSEGVTLWSRGTLRAEAGVALMCAL